MLLAAGGVADHVHLLVSIRADRAIADIVRDIKANSSRWIHETFPGLGGFSWQSGYGAFSVSQSNIDRVRAYLAKQAEHHRTMTFEEEFRRMLERHGLSYDPTYFLKD